MCDYYSNLIPTNMLPIYYVIIIGTCAVNLNVCKYLLNYYDYY